MNYVKQNGGLTVDRQTCRWTLWKTGRANRWKRRSDECRRGWHGQNRAQVCLWHACVCINRRPFVWAACSARAPIAWPRCWGASSAQGSAAGWTDGCRPRSSAAPNAHKQSSNLYPKPGPPSSQSRKSATLSRRVGGGEEDEPLRNPWL